jgi:hypothetical protein
MEEMIPLDSPKLVDAARIWTGRGQSVAPNRDDSRLRLRLGNAEAERLLPLLKELEKDFYSSDAYLRASDVSEMGKLAKADFMRLHPDVAQEITDAFAWCYTFDYR